MKVVYTLASNIYQPSDIERALLFAETAAHQMRKAVRIMLESKAQMPVSNGVNGLAVKGNTFSFNSIQGIIETRLHALRAARVAMGQKGFLIALKQDSHKNKWFFTSKASVNLKR